MTDIDVCILSTAVCQSIFTINATQPRGPQVIVCDHGEGECVEASIINDMVYAESIISFASRSTVVNTINSTPIEIIKSFV